MKCANCGKEADSDSIFCKYCGAKMPIQLAVKVPESQNAVANHENAAVEKKPFSLSYFLLIVALVGVVGLYFYFLGYTPPASAPVSGSTSTAAEISRVPTRSEYSQNFDSIRGSISGITESAISKELANPDTIRVVEDWDKFDNDGVILTNRGTVRYINRNGQETNQPFEFSFVFNALHGYFPLYLKMGDTVLYDTTADIDKNGKIVTRYTTYNGRGYGEQILDGLYNPDNWSKNAADFNNSEGEMTYAEYSAIQNGMTYKEVCKIVGSYGTEGARSNVAGYETVVVMWDGVGQIGANANVTFQNGKVIAKAQMGLQ